jgi:hypothetical protein
MLDDVIQSTRVNVFKYKLACDCRARAHEGKSAVVMGRSPTSRHCLSRSDSMAVPCNVLDAAQTTKKVQWHQVRDHDVLCMLLMQIERKLRLRHTLQHSIPLVNHLLLHMWVSGCATDSR